MKIYKAAKPGIVYVIEGGHARQLSPRLDLRNHSPTGFAWGYGGSGPAQLALAILCDAYDDEKALRFYQRFKETTISAKQEGAPFEMTLDQVLERVEAIEAETKTERTAP